nr:hypothetical protein [Tanacetum cinerariifolium]
MVRKVQVWMVREMLREMLLLFPLLSFRRKSWTPLWHVTHLAELYLVMLLPDSYFVIIIYRDFLKVGMPISTGITASVPYVSENSVYPLLDFIIVRVPTQRNHGPRKDLLYKIPFATAYLLALRRIALAFLFSSRRIFFARWAKLVDAILLSASAFLFSPLVLLCPLWVYPGGHPPDAP